jgi:hypothetical protein
MEVRIDLCRWTCQVEEGSGDRLPKKWSLDSVAVGDDENGPANGSVFIGHWKGEALMPEPSAGMTMPWDGRFSRRSAIGLTERRHPRRFPLDFLACRWPCDQR